MTAVAATPRRRRRWAWLRRGVTLLVFVAVVDYLVLPQIAGTRSALRALGALQPGWLLLGVLLEGASLVGFSMLTRSVLPDRRPSFSWILRSDITGLGVSHVLPGGSATSTALRYRLLREGGAPSEDTVVGLAVQGVGSMVVLVVLLWIGLVVSIPLLGIHLGYVVTATLGAVVLTGLAGLVVGMSRGQARTRAVAVRLLRPLPAGPQARVLHGLDVGAAQVTQLLADRRGLRRFALWASWNWVFDAASLWVFLAAYGWRAEPLGLVVGYGLANLVAGLPISPGGLGVIEAVLIPSLVGLGGPSAIVVLGVVSWRFVEFWAPIPGAGLCYLSLRTAEWRETHEPGTAWSDLRDLFGGAPSPPTETPTTGVSS